MEIRTNCVDVLLLLIERRKQPNLFITSYFIFVVFYVAEFLSLLILAFLLSPARM